MTEAEIDKLILDMKTKNYLLQREDGGFRPGPIQPPESEPELRFFWAYLTRDHAKRMLEAEIEELGGL